MNNELLSLLSLLQQQPQQQPQQQSGLGLQDMVAQMNSNQPNPQQAQQQFEGQMAQQNQMGQQQMNRPFVGVPEVKEVHPQGLVGGLIHSILGGSVGGSDAAASGGGGGGDASKGILSIIGALLA